MIKILSDRLVCTADQSTQLIQLGIAPVGCFCYDFTEGEGYTFAGEYFDQERPLPALTYEELLILIGPEYPKPDLPDMSTWRETADMMLFSIFFPNKRLDYKLGAVAAAELLIYLLKSKGITAADANERMQYYLSGEHYNTVIEKLKYKR